MRSSITPFTLPTLADPVLLSLYKHRRAGRANLHGLCGKGKRLPRFLWPFLSLVVRGLLARVYTPDRRLFHLAHLPLVGSRTIPRFPSHRLRVGHGDASLAIRASRPFQLEPRPVHQTAYRGRFLGERQALQSGR